MIDLPFAARSRSSCWLAPGDERASNQPLTNCAKATRNLLEFQAHPTNRVSKTLRTPRLLKRAARMGTKIDVRVANPV